MGRVSAGLDGRRRDQVLAIVLAIAGHGCATRTTPAVNLMQDRSSSNVPRSSLQNPGFVSMYERTEPEQYVLNAAGPRRKLTTTGYYQRGPEPLELGPEDPVSWDVQIPEGAELFGATTGISPRTT